MLTLGLKRPAVSRLVAAGMIERLTQGVYRIPPHPPTWQQRLLAGILAGPPGTVASHRSAGRLHRQRGCQSDLIEMTCRRWSREHQHRYIVHESLAHDGRDTIVIDGIPVTDLPRTLIDLGAVLHPAPLGRAIDEARRRGEIDLDILEARLEARAVQGRNGITVVRDLIAERKGGLLGATAFEDLFLDIVKRFALPRPELQWKVQHRGRTAFLDFAYPESLVAIEADSEEYHLDLEAFHGDRTRQNWLSLLGWTFLRFTSRHLQQEPRTVAAQIAAAVGRLF